MKGSLRTNPAEAELRSRRALVFSVVAGSAVALVVLLTGPVLVGAYITELGLSEQTAGFMISLEMSGFTLGAISVFAALSRSQRRMVLVALAIMLIANVSSIFAESTGMLAACRFLAGIGSGLLMTMTILVIGSLPQSDSVYGLWTVGQLLLGAIGLLVFPMVIESFGLVTVFGILAGLTAVTLFTARFYPQSGSKAALSAHTRSARGGRWTGWVCLAGVFAYYAGQAGVWVYVERIGVSWNLSQQLVATVLFGSLLAGMIGAGVAVILGDRVGRIIPVGASLALSAIGIVMLFGSGAFVRFAVATGIFNLAWYLFLPYSAAVIAAIDDNGRLLTALSVVFPLALAAGPAVAALFVDNGGLDGPLIVGLSSIPIGLVLMSVIVSRLRAVAAPTD